MKKTNLPLLIEYKPQDYRGLYVSIAPQQERLSSAAAKGDDYRKK